jgi:hypothetical protein
MKIQLRNFEATIFIIDSCVQMLFKNQNFIMYSTFSFIFVFISDINQFNQITLIQYSRVSAHALEST